MKNVVNNNFNIDIDGGIYLDTKPKKLNLFISKIKLKTKTKNFYYFQTRSHKINFIKERKNKTEKKIKLIFYFPYTANIKKINLYFSQFSPNCGWYNG